MTLAALGAEVATVRTVGRSCLAMCRCGLRCSSRPARRRSDTAPACAHAILRHAHQADGTPQRPELRRCRREAHPSTRRCPIDSRSARDSSPTLTCRSSIGVLLQDTPRHFATTADTPPNEADSHSANRTRGPIAARPALLPCDLIASMNLLKSWRST